MLKMVYICCVACIIGILLKVVSFIPLYIIFTLSQKTLRYKDLKYERSTKMCFLIFWVSIAVALGLFLDQCNVAMWCIIFIFSVLGMYTFNS